MQVNLETFVRMTCALGQSPPVLVATTELRKAQNLASAWKSEIPKEKREARERAEQVIADMQAELDGREAQREAQRETERSRRQAQWDTERVRLEAEQDRLEAERVRLEAERAQRDQLDEIRRKKQETWAKKRAHDARQKATLERKLQETTRLFNEERVRTAALRSEVTDLAARGSFGRVAQQRQHAGKRTPFTFRTIHRDLQTRRVNQNSGAANVAPTTAIYSRSIAADGQDIGLESGSERSILRWEKTADIVHVRLEKAHLLKTLEAHPSTKLWFMIDLSPDSRGIEQAGMLFEYAGFEYRMSPFSSRGLIIEGGEISGRPGSTARGVVLGDDGCPIIESIWWKRVFPPMLSALGPKYAGTRDCFTRILQLYGLPDETLCSQDFQFVAY